MPISMTMTPIVFRFIRNDSSDSCPDDIATITYVNKDLYNVSFKSPFSDNKKKKPTVMSLNGKQTFRWVRRWMSMMEFDAEPFYGVQVDMPMMPSIMLRVSSLRKSYHSLLDAVEFQMDNWGSTVCQSCEVSHVPKAPNAPARRNYTAEDEVEDDKSYASMPPLVNVDMPDRYVPDSFRTPPRVNRQHLFFDDEE